MAVLVSTGGVTVLVTTGGASAIGGCLRHSFHLKGVVNAIGCYCVCPYERTLIDHYFNYA